MTASICFPALSRPFGMVQLSPDTEDHGFGYHYIHEVDQGFQHDPHERGGLRQ